MTYEYVLKGFLSLYGLRHVVSFSGGYTKSDGERVGEELMNLFSEIRCRNSDIAILTGGTDWNLPGLVTRVARHYKFRVVGILPEKGKKHQVPGLDLAIVVPPCYGES